jgi:hypothetical protein
VRTDINRTNVPNIRLAFREQTLQAEHAMALGEGFDRAEAQPAVLMDPIVQIEDAAAVTTANAVPPHPHLRLNDVVHSLLAVRHLGSDAPADGAHAPGAALAAAAGVALAVTDPAAALAPAATVSPRTAPQGAHAAVSPRMAPLTLPPALAADAGGPDGAAAHAKRRISVLASIGLLGAAQQRRRVTSESGSGNDGATVPPGPPPPAAPEPDA